MAKWTQGSNLVRMQSTCIHVLSRGEKHTCGNWNSLKSWSEKNSLEINQLWVKALLFVGKLKLLTRWGTQGLIYSVKFNVFTHHWDYTEQQEV